MTRGTYKRIDTIKGVAESRKRTDAARVELLRDVMRSIAKEAALEKPRIGWIMAAALAAVEQDRRIGRMRHPIEDPAVLARKVIPPYISGQEWLDRNPDVYAPKGK